MSTKRTNGEGSLYQRHDTARYGCPPAVDGERPEHKCAGPWVGVLTIGFRDGKPVRKKVSARTRSAAANKLNDLSDLHRANELPEGRTITVEEWLRYWIENIVPRKAKPKTIASYRTNVYRYFIPLIGQHKLSRLTPEHIDAMWDTLLEDGNPSQPEDKRTPLSANSVHVAHRILARALKVAVQRKRLKVNPAGPDSMDAPPRVEHEVVPIPEGDIDKILSAAAGKPYAARWSVALALGLRPGEALGLRWEDVDLDEGVLHVRQQLQRQTGKGLVATSPKSKSGVRSMYLPPTLHAALKAHRKERNEARLRAGDAWEDSGYVFTLDNGRPIDAKVDGERWRKLLERAGVKHWRLYDARHSAATLLLAQGVELRTVMALLGHSQVSVTMKYQHPVDKIKAEAAKRIEAGMWGQA